ncbi:MAG: GAF domain-containing protein, partial [Bacteroidetes bacterium]
PLDRTISQFTLRGQQPVIIADMDEHEEYALLDSYKLGIRSQMSFPIISKGRIIGTLTIGSATANAYRGVQTKALQMVAQQLGVIIDRVQLFSKVSEDAGYIRNLLDSIDNVVYTIGTDYRILEVNRAWTDFLRAYDVPIKKEYHGLNIFDVLPDEELTLVLQKVTGDVFSGSVRYFSQEIVLHSASGEQTFQVTINPLIIDRRITGLVISHNNITELKQTASELKKYSDKLLTLNSIAMLTQTTKTISGILDKAIPMLKNTIEADAIVVFLRDEGTNDLLLTAHSDVKKELLDKMARLSLQASATGNVVKTKHPLFIQKKAYNDARLLVQAREIFKENGVEAFGVIPLISSEQVYGAMVVMYRVQNPFTEQLNQILTLAGNQLGSAVENVRLYSQLQDQVERLSVLYQLSQHLTSTLDVEQIFQFVVEHIQKILSFEELSVGWYDEKTLEITTVFEVARYEGRAQIFSKQGERKRIDAQSAEWLAIQSKRTSVARDGMLLHVPMFSKEKIIGVMSLMQSVKQADVQPQIRLLESIANLVAIALEKAKLYQETMTKTREIERRNKELDDFTYVVSHDLKEPLISIEGFTRIINTDYGESIPAEGKEYLDSIIAASGRMKHLIDDLLMLSRISRPTEAFKPVALHEIIADIRADFEFTLVRKNALLVVEDPLPVIYGNRTHIKILFQNLIGNAIKFNDKERPTVEIGFQNTENNSYLFFVRDNGIGIDKDFQEKIFVIFQRLHPREEYEGTGAGLAIVKKIVEMHKGSI